MPKRDACAVPDQSQRFRDRLITLGIVGSDPELLKALALAEKYAADDLPVLIQGETGTGKEVFARAIHYMSARRARPFQVFAPGASPEELAMNELFGHSAGAYTNADRDQPGIVDIAAGGTLLLDEVQTLSQSDQLGLMRLIDKHEYRPLGGGPMRTADIRIVCATNADLRAAVEANTFRIDLYFRMARGRIEIPPLRDRRGDILVLAEHFLENAHRGSGPRKVFSRCAEEALLSYSWPGNVRELESNVRSAAIKSEGKEIPVENLDLWGCRDEWQLMPLDQACVENNRRFVERYLRGLLAMYKGNITAVA